MSVTGVQHESVDVSSCLQAELKHVSKYIQSSLSNSKRSLGFWFFYCWETLLSLRPTFALFPSLELQDRLPEQTNMPLFLLWSADWLDRPRFLMTKLVWSGCVCTMLIHCLFCSRNQWRRFQTSVCLSQLTLGGASVSVLTCLSAFLFLSASIDTSRDFILSLSLGFTGVPEQMRV